MKAIILLVFGTAISVNLYAHDADEMETCYFEGLNGHWNVFWPDGEELSEQIEDGAQLHIRRTQFGQFLAILEKSEWEVIGDVQSECVEGRAVLSIPIKSTLREAFLCVDRVTTLGGLMKRKEQKDPKVRQIGTTIEADTDDCRAGARITPGHAHADD